MMSTASSPVPRFYARLWPVAVYLFSAIALLIASSSLLFIYKYGYRVLFFDQWVDLAHYINFYNGTFSFKDLFTQHNEHRIVFPRIVFLIDFIVDKGRNRINLCFIVLMQLLHVYLLCMIFKKTNPTKIVRSLGIALAVILLFSLGQYQNFYWGFQVQFVGVGVAASAAFILFVKAIDRARVGLPHWRFALGAYAMLTVATFSMSNGILAGIVMILIAVTTRASLSLTLQSIAVTASLSTVYFLDFHAYAPQPVATVLLAAPHQGLLYFIRYLGDVVGSLGKKSDMILGAIGLAGTIAVLWRLVSRRERDSARTTLTAIILFIAGTAVVTAIGRWHFLAPGESLPSRYFTPTSVFWTCQVFYWQSVIVQLPRRRHLYASALVFLAAFLSAGAIKAHVAGWSQGKGEARLARHASDALLTDVDDPGALLNLFANPQMVEDGAQFLRAHRLSLFASRDAQLLGRRIDDVFSVSIARACFGMIDYIGPKPPDFLAPGEAISGRAWNVTDNQPVDRVLLTNRAGTIIGYASGEGKKTASWQGYLKTGPGDAVAVAYAIVSKKKVCRIAEASVPYNYLARVPVTEVGAVIEAPVEADAAWTIDGQNADAGLPPLTEPVHGSWSGSDGKTGEMTVGPFVSTTGTVLMPMVSGPDTEGLTITISDAATGTVLSTVPVPVMTKWEVVELPVGGDKTGRSIILKFRDGGRNWGQWFAVGSVHAPVSH
jgi:hypothetical protein